MPSLCLQIRQREVRFEEVFAGNRVAFWAVDLQRGNIPSSDSRPPDETGGIKKK